MSKGKPSHQKWFQEKFEAKRAAKKQGLESFFRIDKLKRNGDLFSSYFVGLFLPGRIKQQQKTGSAVVEEIFL